MPITSLYYYYNIIKYKFDLSHSRWCLEESTYISSNESTWRDDFTMSFKVLITARYLNIIDMECLYRMGRVNRDLWVPYVWSRNETWAVYFKGILPFKPDYIGGLELHGGNDTPCIGFCALQMCSILKIFLWKCREKRYLPFQRWNSRPANRVYLGRGFRFVWLYTL